MAAQRTFNPLVGGSSPLVLLILKKEIDMIIPCDFCGKMMQFDDISEKDISGGYITICNECGNLPQEDCDEEDNSETKTV